MASHNAPIRLGSTLGMIGVLLYVLVLVIGAIPIDPIQEAGSYHNVAYGVTLRDLDPTQDVQPSTQVPSNALISQAVNFGGHILTPLLFLAGYGALHRWLMAFRPELTPWLQQISSLGVGIWVLGGVLRVLLIPADYANPALTLSTAEIRLLWMSLSNAILDGGHLLLALHAMLSGWIIFRQGHRFVGGLGMVNGIGLTLIILAGPFDRLTFFSVFAYGAIIVWVFAFCTKLLVFTTTTDETTAPFPRKKS